jgi:SagB-type dehydrogenase family enzyme
MSTRERLSLAPGVSMASLAEGGRRVVSARGELKLPRVSQSVDAALEALSGGGHDISELTELAGRDGLTQAAIFHSLLLGLYRKEMLARSLYLDGSLIAVLAPALEPSPGRMPRAGARYTLSRFAFTHVVEGRWVLEMPLSEGRVWMSTWHGPALLGALAVPRSAADLVGAVPGIPPDAVAAFLRMLTEAGVLTETGADGAPVEREELATWEFHDMLFHRQSRWGLREGVYGGASFRFKGRLPEPGRKPPFPGEVLPLEVPELAEVERRDAPFTAVLERRRSIRGHGARPVTRAQLGELLYRAVGLRHVVFPERGEGEGRPYPSGGAQYETQVYVIAHRCEGLEPGLYHYRVDGHALCRLSGHTPELDLLLKSAMTAAIIDTPPQVLFVLTARFAQMAWKYETMAYAAMLKHVGVIFQTLYLVATAMGLAPCALGGGSAALFARASGLDPFVEGSVGEFILGTPPDAEG